jgi:hypothetical protein
MALTAIQRPTHISITNMTSTKPYRNVVGLSAEKLDELLKNFEKLKDFGEELHDRVVRYVLDGEDEAVLGELAGKTDAAHALGLTCSTDSGIIGRDESDWGPFLVTMEPVDCRFYLRLGKVFEAAARKLPAGRFFCQAWFEDSLWLEILLQEGTQTHARSFSSRERKTAISGSLIENMLTADGRTVDAFVTTAFRATEKQWETTKARDMVLSVANLGHTFAAHCNLIVPFLREGTAAIRQIAVENLARAETPVQPFIAELAECAVDSSKLLRDAAEPLLRQDPEAARPFVEKAAADPKARIRDQAVRLLARVYGAAARKQLEEMQTSEKNAGVKEAIDGALREFESAANIPQSEFELPPHEPIPLQPPVTAALRSCLERIFDDYNSYVVELTMPAATPRQVFPRQALSALDAQGVENICHMLEHGGPVCGALANTLKASNLLWGPATGSYKAFLEHPDCQLIHVVRLLAMVDSIHSPQDDTGMYWRVDSHIELYRRSHTPKITLSQLAEAIRSLKLSDDILAHEVLENLFHFSFDWEAEAVWPFFSGKLELLEKAMDPPVGDRMAHYYWNRGFDRTLRVLAKFPQVPPSLVGKLWDMAIGTSKADRLRAQKIVVKLPDLSDRLLQALSARASETRAVTAEWIGRLGDRQYVTALHKAAKAEKIDAALDEMLTALERLGEEVEPYLDRKKLLADAQKQLKKGTPPALDWFPWAQLPKVRWQDKGKEVPKEVVTWLIVQNFKFKSPEAGPLLRRYCAMMRPADRAELGQFVLGAWLGQDLKRTCTDAECRAEAQKRAAVQFQQYQQVLQTYQQRGQTPPAGFNVTLQQIEDSIFHQLQREVGSAVAEKGILAVAGACCDASAVGPVQKYLKDWYGYRAAQCKALIAMLSTIDHPSATQFLLSIANRFRTKGIREEAEKYVNSLAERKGWTLDELADRTLPTAGFDDDGTLELSFGPRQFYLRVTPNLEAVLSDADGKTLKALPAPRKDDDEEQAKAAKKALSAAKTELKKFTGMQTTRLYEAMCTQRTWTIADWRTYLARHPLMKFLCQRLVWAAEILSSLPSTGSNTPSPPAPLPSTGEGRGWTFRPLDDGTFTDYEDNEVQLPADARLRIAHSRHVPSESVAAWTAHLADYGVTPLFTQFGRTTYALPEEKRRETAINDFEGHLVEAFKLRSLATKFGYARGQAQDGGWFFDYIKSFPGLGLKVVLNFSGNGMPEENRTVALKGIAFQQSAAEEESMMQMSGGMALDEVPAVLLSECYNDLRTIAAAGTGFDAEWEKKIGY